MQPTDQSNQASQAAQIYLRIRTLLVVFSAVFASSGVADGNYFVPCNRRIDRATVRR